MKLYYVQTPSIYIAIDGNEIVAIKRRTDTTIPRFAIVVNALGATQSEGGEVRDGILYADGLMIVELAGWLCRQLPQSSVNRFGRRFFQLFENGDTALLNEIVKAVCRIVFDQSSHAVGEDAFFISQQWKCHPEQFTALVTAQRLKTKKQHNIQ